MGTESKLAAPIFLVGATGTGKSAAAMELARQWGGAKGAAILCMDAMQVYRGADIGTSKPTAAERAEIPHGGLDLVELGASFDVAQYLKHAAAFLEEQRQAGRRVIVVGGTGLYFRALTRGLCDAPQGSDELRAELAAMPVEKLRARLETIDPEMVTKIDALNPRRLIRAIEVKEATGRSLLDWQAETPEALVRDFTGIWIQREKEELARRIEARVEEMFSQGWVEEVRGLMAKYGEEAVRQFPGIGYREIAEKMSDGMTELTERKGSGAMVPGRLSSPIQVEDEKALKGNICVSTRQYAKRQLTWFAREPILQRVMLTGSPSFSAVLRTAVGLIE